MTAQLERPTEAPIPPPEAIDPEAPATPRGSVARNVGSMLLGRMFVAAAGWIGSIAIARALGSEQWGQYSFVFGLLGVLSVITDLGVGRLVLARLLEFDDASGARDDEARLVASSFIALRVVLGLFGYAAAMAYVVLAAYPGDVIAATAIAGLVVVVATPSHALSVLFQSRLKLTVVSVIESLSQVVQLAATVIAVLVAPVLLVVVIPAVLFEVVSLIGKARFVGLGRLGYRPTKRIEIWRWSEMLREALPLSIGFALTVLLTRIDIPILSKLGSFDAVGHYAIAYKFSDLVSVIGIAITTPMVTMLVAAWPTRPAQFRARIHDAAVLTTLLGGMAVIGIWPAASPLIRLLYGESYADAGHATRLLVLSAGLSSFTLLGVMTLVSAGRNRIFPMIAAGGLVLNVVLNIVLIPRFSFNGSAFATISTEVLVCALIWAAVLYEIRLPGLLPWRRLGGLVVLTVLLTLAATLLTPTDSAVGIVIGAIGALALPVAAKLCRLTPAIDPRRLLSGTPVPEDDDPDNVVPGAESTVVHTFFGPEDTPLFGTVHIPASMTARAGMVICPPLGKEQVDTTRGVRLLAEDLADTGVVALRFDYLHTGESWGRQDAPDAVEGWIAGVEHAVRHLRDMGVTRVGIVGLRAGALIATAAARRIDDVEALVLWDPVLRGRSFVRGQQQLFRIAVAAESGGELYDPDAHDTVQIVGATWHHSTATQLSAMKVDVDAAAGFPVLLAVAGSMADSAPVRALMDVDPADPTAARPELMTIGDTTGFVTPPSFFVELPKTGVEHLGGWIDAHLPTATVPVSHTARTSAVVHRTPDGAGVTTEIRTAPDGATVWVTRSETTDPHTAVVVHSTANDTRIGPGRIWQDTAIRAAEFGALTVRYDRVGVGESGAVNRGGDFAALHSADAIRDAHRASEIARNLVPGRLTHVGVCSGAWTAARVALDDHRRDRVVLINLLTWRVEAPVLGAEALPALYPTASPSSAKLRQKIKPFVVRYVPYAAFDLLARAGVMQSPRLLLAPLARAGGDVRLIFGTVDYAHFVSQRGLQALSTVARRTDAPTVDVVLGGDHAGFHPAVREGALAACLHAIIIERQSTS